MKSRLILVAGVTLTTAAAVIAIWWFALREESEPDRQPARSPAPPLEIGIHTGTSDRDLAAARKLNAGVARVEFDIATPITEVTDAVDRYAAAGIRVQPIAGFYARAPTPSDVTNLRAWGRALGPTSPRWKGRTEVAVTHIEFGNETSFADQGTQRLGAAYARQAKAAAIALRPSGIKLLVQADDANQVDGWINQMFAAVPDLGEYAGGWIVHPYGRMWEERLTHTIGRLMDNGVEPQPIYITEFGLASDDGRCLSDNYRWDPCMTLAQASRTLDGVVDRIIRAYPQVVQLIVYHGLDLRKTGSSTEREHYFGALRQDLGRKGEYTDTVTRLTSVPLTRSCAPGPSFFRDRWIVRCVPGN